MAEDAPEVVETHNDYQHPVHETDVPIAPINLYTRHQLKEAVQAVVRDEAEVQISDSRTESVAGVKQERISGKTLKVYISWEIFDTEETLNDAGWDVIVSALDHLDALDVDEQDEQDDRFVASLDTDELADFLLDENEPEYGREAIPDDAGENRVKLLN